MNPIDKFIDKLEGVKPSGDGKRQWVACCPAHDDNKQSFALGENSEGVVLVKCYAGCSKQAILSALGFTDRDFYPEKDRDKPTPTAPAQKITVRQLALDKRLPSAWLHELGLSNEDEGVSIPYYGPDKKKLFTRTRTSLVAKEGSKQPYGVQLVAYGLWRLADATSAKRLVLVEGESDCWTLWHHGIPALGLPGSNAAKTLTADLLAGIDELFVWQEPGDGGETFVNDISRKLKSWKWEGKARVVSLPAVKDPNALHQVGPDEFKSKFDAVLSSGKDMPPPQDLKKKRRERPKAIVADIYGTLTDKWKKNPVGTPLFYPLTDMGNAERLVKRYGKTLRYCHPWLKWLVWDGVRWQKDESGEIFRLAVETVRSIHGEASDDSLPADRKAALVAHAIASESARSIENMVKHARNMVVEGESMPVSPDGLDADPWLICCANGTVDLRTGECKPHSRNDYITKLSPVHFDADAKCPVWDKFLDRIMGGDKEMIRFLQLAIGYSLTGIVSEKCFFFLYGLGDNGKSRMVEAVQEMLGDYQAKTTAETILDRGQNSVGIPNDVARLIGTRFVSTAELPEGRRLDEARVKDLTGNDTISARFMRAEWFQFRPVFKLWMYGNHKPQIKNADDGMWRRVRLVPFNITIPKAEQDKELDIKLRSELSGIFNWAIAGCLEWQKTGLPTPKAVIEATADYRTEMDTLQEFINERCLVAANAIGSSAEIYNAYVEWAKHCGEYVVSRIKFGMKLKDRGYKPYRNLSFRGWYGITVKTSGSATAGGADLTLFDE